MEVTTKRVLLYKEAKEIVDKINTGINDIRALILQLYEGEGWTSLGYANWRECVVAEFKQSQAYLYRQLEAAQTEKIISPNGEKKEIPESQLRPLTKLKDDPEQQREAWAKAVETAPDGKVTAAHVAKVVKEFTEEKRKEEEEGKEKKEDRGDRKKEENGNLRDKKDGKNNIPEHAILFVTIALSHLERIKPDDPSREKAFSMLKEWIKENE